MLLLPPSEGKAEGGSLNRRNGPWEPASGAFATLSSKRAEVAHALDAAGGGSERLLGVRGDHLSRAVAVNSTLIGAPTLPAWQRYTGVVWGHLDPATLSPVQRRRIVVVSGLLGVARADDRIPDYRLKMSARLPALGTLSRWWRADLSAALNAAARRRVVVDLLPNEHRAAWIPQDVEGVRVTFVDPTGAPGGHFAKAAKGRFARALLTDGLDALGDWRDDRFELLVSPL